MKLDQPREHRPWLSVLLYIALALAVLFVISFLLFAQGRRYDAINTPEKPTADGIVILTGMSDERIRQGLALLGEGYAKRALVSGVHKSADMDKILSFAEFDAEKISCCVDLDYRATNTVGNAGETAMWVRIHGYRSIIMVTSTHHIPRSLIELRRVIPNVFIHPYPVNAPGVQIQSWWRYPGTLGLLLGEYVRYLLSLFDLTGNHMVLS
jgi:uncharacterized SAM-binding protein YcdF (DUF218 family)